MKPMVLVPLAALALAACQQQSVSLTNASPEEVAKAASAAGTAPPNFNPGQWETRVEVLELNIPGMEKMPKELGAQMKAEMMKVRTDASCMTPEEAKKPKSEMFTGQQNKNCTFSKYEMSGGKIDATMVCKDRGNEMKMQMSGTFSTDSFTVEQVMDATGGPAGGMHGKARVSGKRLGDCPAAGTKAK